MKNKLKAEFYRTSVVKQAHFLGNILVNIYQCIFPVPGTTVVYTVVKLKEFSV